MKTKREKIDLRITPVWSLPARKISLTLEHPELGAFPISIGITELITYAQFSGFTRLKVKGSKVLDVLETTDEIDRRIRAVAELDAN